MNDPEVLNFYQSLSKSDREAVDALNSPLKIQEFLDQTEYSSENTNRSPLEVFHDRIAHCLDGALFGAAMLRLINRPPLIIDLLPEPGIDDDHVLAIYKENNLFGAVAKSNFTGLRYREPIFKTSRELVLSYFEDFFNVSGQKTLRGYSRIIDLRVYDHFHWMNDSAGVDKLEKRLYSLKRIPLFKLETSNSFSLVDPISYRAGMLVVNPAGLYKPNRE
jgi:hypothetical protein